METFMSNTVHILLALLFPPLLLGVINRTKAMFAGRNGPPLLQPYYDLIRLFQKGSVFSTTTTWVFRAGPVVGLVTAAIAVLLVPLINSVGADLVHRRYDSVCLSPGPRAVFHDRRRRSTRAPPSRAWGPREKSPSLAWPNRRCFWACSFWRGSRGNCNWRACWAVRWRRTGQRRGPRWLWSC